MHDYLYSFNNCFGKFDDFALFWFIAHNHG